MATIVKAKEKVTAAPNPPQERLSDYFNRISGNTTEGKKRAILSMGGVPDRGGILTMDEASPLNESARSLAATEKAKGGDLIGARSTGVDESSKLQLIEMADDMYNAADEMGYTTADQFRTAYENLKKASPRTRQMTSDPKFDFMTQTGGASLKDVLAKHFEQTVKSRNEEKSKKTSAPAPKLKVTKETIVSPSTTPAPTMTQTKIVG